MNKRKKNVTMAVILMIIASIGGLAYWLWVKSIALPMIGELNSYEAETVDGEKFMIQDGTVKLVSIAEENCTGECEEMYGALEEMQERLIKDKNFGTKVDMLSIAENPQMDKKIIEHYKDTYHVNEKGWKFLFVPNEKLELFKNQINNKKEAEPSVTLVDAKGNIRQHYQLKDEEEKEQLRKDINQLIRIHQQSIEERR